jgi:glycosyltransferase involved in cell wall biosynthesis
MRILHCLDTIDPAFGGPVEAARQFARFCSPENMIEVASLDDDVSQWIKSWPVPVHALGQGFSFYRYNPQFVKWLRAHHENYDAVVVHGLFRYNLTGAWKALRGTGCPYFVIPHGMLNPWFKTRYPAKHLRKQLFWYTQIKPALQAARKVIYLTAEERQLANHTFDVSSFSSLLLPLGIEDPASIVVQNSLLAQHPHLAGKRLIVFFGRICEMKGCDILLQAFAESNLPQNAVLVFAGPNNEGIQSNLEQLSVRSGIADRVVWLGPVYGTAKFELLRAAELFALPSHCETFPVAVLESLASGTPVLISDQVNLWSTIKNDGAGLICRDSVSSITEKLNYWFHLDESVRKEMKHNARTCFEQNYRIEHAVRLHEESLRICSRREYIAAAA